MSYTSYLHMDCELYVPREDGGYNLFSVPKDLVEDLADAIEATGDFEDIDVWNGCDGSVNYDYYVQRLLDLSKQFPNILFSVEREGGNTGDLEREYYLGGGVQSCPARIIYDEFNPADINGGEVPKYQPEVEIDTSEFL